MSEFYSDEAIRLAQLPYLTIVFLDKSDGDEGYIAINPQLDGCMSQGDTPEEAIENLADARTLYIESLLEDDLPVPQTNTSNNIHIVINMAELTDSDFQPEQSDELITNLEIRREFSAPA